MRKRSIAAMLVACFTCLSAMTAQAHFMWLLPTTENGKTVVKAHFSEDAEVAEAELLERLVGLKPWHRVAAGEPHELGTERTPEGFVIKAAADKDLNEAGVIGVEKSFGITNRGNAKFILQYYAKTYSGKNPDFQALGTSKPLRLDIVPAVSGNNLTVTVSWEGKPVANSEVVIKGPGLEGAKQVTDAEGHVTVKLNKPGLIAIRARHIEAKAGQFEGQDYAEVRHYVTLTLPWENSAVPAASTTDAAAIPPVANLPQLPEGITSFGGATFGDFLYVYGGNTAEAHHYSYATQSPRFRRLNLKSPKAWEELAPGPRLQGTALVACRGKLVRVGGFTAHNAEGEEHNLWSIPDVAAYDPEAQTWTNLPPLPAPRSSHDAAVIGETIYVVGGWQLRGTTRSEWHDSAWALDLFAEEPAWKALAAPGFKRRALSVAELDGKLYAIGGMQTSNKITHEVSVYDPATDKWSTAANLPGEGMEGFGTAAFSINKHLVVTTRSGKVWSLDAAANAWQANDSLKHPRFFHRITPMSNVELVVFGGTSGDKVLELETVRLK